MSVTKRKKASKIKPVSEKIRRRIQNSLKNRKDLQCKMCEALVEHLSIDTHSVICDVCVSKMAEPPIQPKSKLVNPDTPVNPRGWQRRKYFVDASGQAFSFGKKVTTDDGANTNDSIVSRKSKTESKIKTKTGKKRGKRGPYKKRKKVKG